MCCGVPWRRGPAWGDSVRAGGRTASCRNTSSARRRAVKSPPLRSSAGCQHARVPRPQPGTAPAHRPPAPPAPLPATALPAAPGPSLRCAAGSHLPHRERQQMCQGARVTSRKEGAPAAAAEVLGHGQGMGWPGWAGRGPRYATGCTAAGTGAADQGAAKPRSCPLSGATQLEPFTSLPVRHFLQPFNNICGSLRIPAGDAVFLHQPR